MKKTLNVAIGGCSFTIDDDAYKALEEYLDSFKAGLDNSSSSNEVMDELEMRIADLLKEKIGRREVIDLSMVDAVLNQIGPISTRTVRSEESTSEQNEQPYRTGNQETVRKFYRDAEGKKIAGVCSGLALYLNIDVTLVRIIFLVAFLCGSAGFWIYIVLWIVAPEARTAAEKCELRGIPATAENIRRFTENRQ
ncbi:MAG: PspC domain-containing protein [Bacteroidales bacterium]|nr:PspC domain-containing protein [Bacteroidales bacterium]